MTTSFRRSAAFRVRLAALALPTLLLCALVFTELASAQINVAVQVKRRNFLRGEAVVMTATISNQTGREVILADTEEGGPWFSLQVTNSEGKNLPALDPNYQLPPLRMQPGETVKRSVNLFELFPLGEYGMYRVKASVFFAPIGKYFPSRNDLFNVTEGHKIWKQTVGVPDSPESLGLYRDFTLIKVEGDRGNSLYVRVEGHDDGAIYGCYALGRLLEGYQPDIKLDTANNLAVLQMVERRTYLLSRIGCNGQLLDQSTYLSVKAQASLRRLQDGTLQIVGAVRQANPVAQAPQEAPKLSDRPAALK